MTLAQLIPNATVAADQAWNAPANTFNARIDLLAALEAKQSELASGITRARSNAAASRMTVRVTD